MLKPDLKLVHYLEIGGCRHANTGRGSPVVAVFGSRSSTTGGSTSIEPTSTTMLDGLPLCMLALNIHLIDRPWKEEQELGPQ